jgi:serine/threonine-protein kinase
MSEGRTHLAQAHVGRVLREKWRLDALLGIGAMAAVYAATHRNGMRAAVKLLHPELAADQNVRTRFLREGYAANKIDHPGCVSVLDDDVTEDGSVFLVMELLVGETLDERAERRGAKLPLAEVVAAADQVLDVLAAAHVKGIIHRDIKPGNLFITRDGAVKVLDFGIARLLENQGATATMTGAAMGTPAFMPPEQSLAEWDKVDGRTDIWALGATMFTLLTGRFVHEAESVTALLVAISSRPVQPIASVLPGIPKEIAAVIDRSLAQRPQDRWPDARAMQAALRAAAKVLPEAGPDGVVPPRVTSRPSLPEDALPPALKGAAQADSMLDAVATRPYRKKGPRVYVLLAAAGAVVVGAVLAFALLGREPDPSARPEGRPSSTAAAASPSAAAVEPAGGVPSVSPASPAAAPEPSGSALAPSRSAQPSVPAPEKKLPATTPKPRGTGDVFDEFK